MEWSVVHFKPHFFLHSHLFFFFSYSPLWLLPLYIDKMLSCIWKMVSGRNTEFTAWHVYIGQRKFD